MATINELVKDDVESAIVNDDADHATGPSEEEEIAALEEARADAESDMEEDDPDTDSDTGPEDDPDTEEDDDAESAEARQALYLTQTDAVNKIIAQYPSDSGSQELDDPAYDEALWNLNAKILQCVKSFNRAYRAVQTAIENRGSYIGDREYLKRVEKLGDTGGWSIVQSGPDMFTIYGPPADDAESTDPVDKGSLPAAMVVQVATMYIGEDNADMVQELFDLAKIKGIPIPPKRGRKSSGSGSNGSATANADRRVVKNAKRIDDAGKSVALARWNNGDTAAQISDHLADLGYGTNTGYAYGTGQVASWLPNRNA